MTTAEISLEFLQVQLSERNQQIAEQGAEILCLKEQISWLARQIFGRKSERLVDADHEQLKFDGFETVEQSSNETKTVSAHERKKRTSTGKDTIKLPEDLPIET